MDSSIHILIASTHAQQRINAATGARHANRLAREAPRVTSTSKPRARWHRRSAPATASIGTRH